MSAADYVHGRVKRAKALASRGIIKPLETDHFRIPERLQERVQAMPAIDAQSPFAAVK